MGAQQQDKKKARRTYSEAEREQAFQRAKEVGPYRAGNELGIPGATVSLWFRKAMEAARAASQTESESAEEAAPVMPEKEEVLQSTESASEPKPNGSKVARRYTPSEKAVILEYAAAHGVSAAHEKYGASRPTIYEWRRKLRLAAEGKGPSPTSGSDPDEVRKQRDQEILGEWRRHRGLGPSQIKNQLGRRGIRVAVGTVRRVMEEAGYRPPKVRRHEHDERFEAARPNHLWHLDFLHRNINRASTFTLILIDDHSRFVVGHGVDDAERADLVIETFERAVTRYGRPESVMHDRGSAFWSWSGMSRFSRLLEELGVDQMAVKHKEHNGKVEVFNANLAKELFDVHHFYDLAEMKRRLSAHLDWYNHQRTSHALGGLLVPADRYYGRADEVMARIAAGAAQSPDLHGIDLRDRAVDLLRVVQRGGAQELWLMGRKVLSFGQST